MTNHAKALLCCVAVSDELRKRTKSPADQAEYETALDRLSAYIEELERKAQYWDDLLKREAEAAAAEKEKKHEILWLSEPFGEP